MNSQFPVFSIVIPTYQRPAQLMACLHAVANLEYPRERFEVLVVDDGSAEPPEELVRSFRDRIDVTLYSQPHTGPAQARNTGGEHARGDFLAFTDDDCQPAPDWLRTLASRVIEASDCAVGGETLNALPENTFSTATHLLIDCLYRYYNTNPERATFFTSNNLALSTQHFRAIGGFDITFPLAAGEDREFCDRWLAHGRQLCYAPEARVYHAHPLTLRTFWKQHFNYGRGAFRFHQVRERRDHRTTLLKPMAFYWDILRFPFSQTRGGRAWRLALVLTLSQGATAVGVFWERFCAQQRLASPARNGVVCSK